MRNCILLIFMIVLLSSCATMRWKRNYVNKKMSVILSKYAADTFEVTLPTTLAGESIKQSTKKQIKENVKVIEKAFALKPDSIAITNGRIDSFYFNKNKIQYIKQHNLNQSKNIIINT